MGVLQARRSVEADRAGSDILSFLDEAGAERIEPISMCETDVQCPADIEVKAGTTSSCTAQLDGQRVRFTITQQDDNGNLQIDRDGFLIVPAMATSLQQLVEEQLGVAVTAACGNERVIVAAPGEVISCSVAAVDDPTAPLDFAATVTDSRGNVAFEQAG